MLQGSRSSSENVVCVSMLVIRLNLLVFFNDSNREFVDIVKQKNSFFFHSDEKETNEYDFGEFSRIDFEFLFTEFHHYWFIL